MRKLMVVLFSALFITACAYDDDHYGYGHSGRYDGDRDDYGYGSYYPYGRADYPRDRIYVVDGYHPCRYYSYQGYCYRYPDDYYRAMDWDRKHGYDDNWHNRRKAWCNQHDCRREHDNRYDNDGDRREQENRHYRQEDLRKDDRHHDDDQGQPGRRNQDRNQDRDQDRSGRDDRDDNRNSNRAGYPWFPPGRSSAPVEQGGRYGQESSGAHGRVSQPASEVAPVIRQQQDYGRPQGRSRQQDVDTPVTAPARPVDSSSTNSSGGGRQRHNQGQGQGQEQWQGGQGRRGGSGDSGGGQ